MSLFPLCELCHFWPQILWKCIDSGYLVSATPYTISCLSLCNFAHLFFHGLKMCMWFGFNPAVNFCHFSTLLTLSVFAGATSTSPKFDLFSLLTITVRGVCNKHCLLSCFSLYSLQNGVLGGYTVFSKSVVPKFRQHLMILLYNFDSFCPILFKFTHHHNHQTNQQIDRKIGAEGSVLQELCHFVILTIRCCIMTIVIPSTF